MAVYKVGSRGEAVRQVQRLLGLAADGVFGVRTAAAVRVFQQAAGLVADGVAGPVTLARLRECSPVIAAGYISRHITRYADRPVRYIAIHYTAGGSSRRGSAMAARNVFLSRNASADFVVDDEQIVQVNPDIRNCYCWAVGDKRNPGSGGGTLYGVATNKNTVSIEVCSNLQGGTTAAVPNHDGWSFTDKALGNALRLVRYLMLVYGIPKDNVVRHYDISGKLCPGIAGWNGGILYTTGGKALPVRNNSRKWLAFKERI